MTSVIVKGKKTTKVVTTVYGYRYMIVALFGDIHANLPALEAVLDHANTHGAEQFWNTGDFLGYGAFPNEIFDCLRKISTKSVLGNYDYKVLNFQQKQNKWKKNKHPDKYLAFQWANRQLSTENEKALRALPINLRFEVEGIEVLMVHGSPESIDELISNDTPLQRLEYLAKISNADMIVCGHSHQPFDRQVEGVWFINPGSVGRPDDGDPRAAYALLDISQGRVTIQHFRIAYDIERAVKAIRKAGLPEVFAQMIQQGYDLATLESILGHE